MKLLLSFLITLILLAVLVDNNFFARAQKLSFVFAPKYVFAQGDAGLNANPYTPNKTTTGPGSLPSSDKATFCTKVGNATGPNPCPVVEQRSSSGASGEHPISPEPPKELRQAIIDQFGITMNGFSEQNLRWVWEKFWDVSNTNFNSLVRGSIINITSTSNTQQVGCPGSTSVLLGGFSDADLFKHVLIHELGHVVANCNSRERAQREGHLNAYAKEKGVSYYSNNAPSCTGSDNLSEDYAEMVAYYLNPGYSISTVKCSPPQLINIKNSFPLHYAVAKTVLGNY